MKPFVIGVIVVCVLIVAGLGLTYYFYEPPPIVTNVVDRLCASVRGEQKMDCVAVLAAETFMKPGAVVDYQGSAAEPSTVPLPTADLFGPACGRGMVELLQADEMADGARWTGGRAARRRERAATEDWPLRCARA